MIYRLSGKQCENVDHIMYVRQQCSHLDVLLWVCLIFTLLSELCLFCVEYACSPCACVPVLNYADDQVLSPTTLQSKNMHLLRKEFEVNAKIFTVADISQNFP